MNLVLLAYKIGCRKGAAAAAAAAAARRRRRWKGAILS